jgi:exonuclease III
MRVVSWNVGHNPASWSALEDLRVEQKIALALLQEAVPPLDDVDGRHVRPDRSTEWITDLPHYPRKWRTAVVWWGDIELEHIETKPLAEVAEDDGSIVPASYPGTFAAVRANGTALVSLYAPWEHLPGSRGSYALASLHRAISDLTRLWYGYVEPKVVIAGDWNVWHNYGNAPRSDIRAWSKRSDAVFRRLEAEGLELKGPFGDKPLDRCPCGPRADCRHLQTYWHNHKEDSTPYQTDYVAATKAVKMSAPRVVSHVGSKSVWSSGLSDHAPVLFEIED